MARNGGEPRVPALIDSKPQTSQKKAHMRKRCRHCKSAPIANMNHEEVNSGSDPRSQPTERKVHQSFRQVAIFLALYLGLGTLCFSLVRNQIEGKKTNGILDAAYFCVVTMTTLGYGDLVPNSVAAKLLACAFVFLGMALVGLILTNSANYLVEKQEKLLVKSLHMHQSAGPNIENLKDGETSRVRYKCAIILILLLVLMIAGTIFLKFVEKLDFVDAFYCVCSTITTLGYGDISFTTQAGRTFAIFWILISTLCLAQFFLSIAELNSESRQRSLVKWVLTRRLSKLDLEAADLDDDGVVDLAEFIVFKLKEMGKISQEDIALVTEEFEDLDVDQSGTLSASDATLAQSKKISERYST